MKALVEHFFTGATNPSTNAYDPTKTELGPLITQATGINPENKWAGPLPILLGRPMEAATNIPVLMVAAIKISDDKQWIFAVENSTGATAVRRVVCWEMVKSNQTLTWKGFITLTLGSATAHTVRAFRVTRDLYSTGTVQVAATAVTGSGTGWLTARYAVGARIGFGSTDPKQISTWYQITAMASDTGITLGATAGTIAAGTPYVIEELRVVYVGSNATTTNGGVHYAKGLNLDIFTSAGTTIALAGATDNVRAVYWLKDAATVTNTIPVGCGLGTKISDTQHDLYVIDLPAGTTPRVFKYNLRAALTVASGITTSAWTLTTGTYTVVGTMVVTNPNNGRVGTLNHGPGAGVECLYFTTPSRIYRAPLSGILSASTTWVADAMTEVVPGGSTTFAPTLGTLSAVEVADSIDRLIVCTTGAAGTPGMYVTQYRTDGGQMDHRILAGDLKSSEQTTASVNFPPYPSFQALPLWAWSENGMLWLLRSHATTAGTAANNHLYGVPCGADWTYAASTGNRLITPSMSLPNAAKLYRAYVNEVEYIGGEPFITECSPYRLYARTAGITDDSGSWTLLSQNNDLSALAATGTIQFMFEFKCLTLGLLNPSRIMSVACAYETTDALLSQFQWSLEDSSLTDGTFGFSQIATFGGTVPGLTINYYRSDTNALLLTQASSGTTNGVFEYWTGSAWSAGLGADTIGVRRRFRPTAGLPSGVEVYAKISLT